MLLSRLGLLLPQKGILFNSFLRQASVPLYMSAVTRFQKYKFASDAKIESIEKTQLDMHQIEDLDKAPICEEMIKLSGNLKDVRLPHASYTIDQLEKQTSGHHVPKGFNEMIAFISVMSARSFFDFISGYSWLPHTEKLLLRRVVFLETVAGIPGMVGALHRHLKSLRRMEQDYGWIHTLLEEAENERMHLLTALLLYEPKFFMKSLVFGSQLFFGVFYSIAYLVSPVYCHRFVGYLEEEAFKTYSGIIKEIDKGKLPGFTKPAPLNAIRYWNMPENSTLREIFLAIRADENHHRIVNHTFAAMDSKSVNPFPPGY